MSFVHTSAERLQGSWVLENVSCRWVPEAGVIDGRNGDVLGDSGDPSRYSLGSSLIGGYDQGDLFSSAHSSEDRLLELSRTLTLESCGIAG